LTILDEKVLSCKKGIIDSYNRRKTVDKFIYSEQTAAMDDLFLNIGIKILGENIWFSSSSHYPCFDNLGDSVAIGEEKYLLDTLISKSDSEEIDSTGMDYHQLTKFSENFLMNSVLLVPIEVLYSRMLQDPSKWLIVYDNNLTSFVMHFGNYRIPVYGIHGDVIASNLIFLNKELGKWSYKTYPNPQFGKKTETIYVDISEVDNLKVEMVVYSSIKFEIDDIKKAKRLKMV
jgi:hypothetical protein